MAPDSLARTMKTLEEIRSLTGQAGSRQQPTLQEPNREERQQMRQRCARLRELAEQRVVVAAQAEKHAVEVPLDTADEYSYLERLYGTLGYRTAPAGGDYSSRVITITWD
ncbi:MAG: hypothetical protein JWR44_3314 [Hymenobacter sp.]|jgi:hypothetical protein|nr:hypothetical protein [Hymenobacter sp.]